MYNVIRKWKLLICDDEELIIAIKCPPPSLCLETFVQIESMYIFYYRMIVRKTYYQKARFLSREKFEKIQRVNWERVKNGRLLQKITFLMGSEPDNKTFNKIVESLILNFFRDLVGC
jgi:hypothetical protein